jgi:hypothetical protein
MRTGILAAAAIFGIAGFVSAAAAAPQVLLVVTPTDELPLTCENGRCTAEVAAICLQPERANPDRGKRYNAAASSSVPGAKSTRREDTMTLVGEARDGRQVMLPTERYLSVLAERDHFAVTLSVDESVKREFGVVALAVRITGNVLLFPDAEPLDAKPQTESDKQIAQTTLRGVAQQVLEKRGDTLEGASVVRSAINALPRDRGSSEAERRKAQADALRARVSPKAKAHAEEAFSTCGGIADGAGGGAGAYYGYRHCLGIMHDELIDGVNREYWDALKAGS